MRCPTCWWPSKSTSDILHVGDDGLDTVTATFDLDKERRHLVPLDTVSDGQQDRTLQERTHVELVVDVTTNVDSSHIGQMLRLTS
jgi:hypothetical protein